MNRSRWLTLLVSLVATPTALLAQVQTTVTGTIRTPAGQPIASAQVQAVGTPTGARSDANGAYRLVVSGTAGQAVTLRASKIGHLFQLARITLRQGAMSQDFTMPEQAAALNAVVVTGSPTGTATRREVANVVTQLPVSDIITRAPSIPNITQALQSRVPGVQVMTQSGTEGTAPRVRIRGVSSINASSSPIYVIDGVRMSGGTQTGFDLSGASQSASDAVHPQDIESFEVIKGPAAATLYGADAANGVISITTKRGKPGEQSVKVTALTSYGQQVWGGNTNTNYTLCTQARITGAGAGTVGSYPGCAGKTAGDLITADFLRDDPNALRTGHTRTTHLDATGGGERYGFYLGGNYDDNDGVVYNNTFKRYSGRANVTLAPSDKLGGDVNVGYYRTDVRLPLSDNASNGLTRNANRGIPGRQNSFAIGWLGLSPAEINSFDDQTRSDRFVMSATLRYTPFSWFSHRFSGGFDYSNRKNEQFYAIDTTGKAPFGSVQATGLVNQFKPISAVYTLDYAGTVSSTLPRSLTSELSFGAQLVSNRSESLQGRGDGLPSNTVRLISLASNRTAFETRSEQSTVGVLLQEKIGFRDRLFVTGGLRADGNSAFGKDYAVAIYPKLGASYVVSDEPFFDVPGVDEFRLRGAWGRAGNSPSPYAADRTYVVNQMVNSDNTIRPGLVPSNYGNPQLYAEKGEELELGFDASFLKGRVSGDFTFFNKTTKDALVNVPAAPSSGFTLPVLQNVGTINNKGTEMSLTLVPVELPNVNWESKFGFATLKNRFVDFGGVRTQPIYTGFSIANFGLRIAPGTEIPQFFGTVPSRDASGTLLRNANGSLVVDRDTVYFGGSLPTKTLSWDNNVTLMKDLKLGMLLDYQGGHYQFNLTRRTRTNDGVTQEVVDPAADQGAREILLSGAGAQWIEKADFLKLREVSLNYTLPERFSARLGSDRITLSVSGRNLKTWTDYTGSDPEVNADSGDFLLAETNAIPPTRRITTSISFRF
jgi:TonB-linked SusC/RagA family outer membrane protein